MTLKSRPWKRFLSEHRRFLVFLLLLGLFRGAIADWNPVPTGSMNPTIVEGDVIWVNKLAYDLKLPFTQVSLAKVSGRRRGDIVVFKSAKADKRLVKRLVGMPGDQISLVNNRLVINGHVAHYRPVDEKADWLDLTESLRGLTHAVRVSKWTASPASNFGPVSIPDGYYLMLGDNRDNSADSRFYGLVPRHELIGRASHVLLSLNPEHFYAPRFERTVKPLL